MIRFLQDCELDVHEFNNGFENRVTDTYKAGDVLQAWIDEEWDDKDGTWVNLICGDESLIVGVRRDCFEIWES